MMKHLLKTMVALLAIAAATIGPARGQTTYNVTTARLAEGTEDAANWTLASGSTLTTGTNVLGGVEEGSTLTATYSGDRVVESVKAVKSTISLSTPLTMEALTAGTIVVSSPQEGMKYSINDGAKTTTGIESITVQAGDKVAFYGNGTSITSYNGTKFTGGSAQVMVYGNIMSLLDEDNFSTATTLPQTNNYGNMIFCALFQGNANLTDASGMLLPATTLTMNCYNSMFNNCGNLVTAPALPATTLASYCYSMMFSGCSSLEIAPVLPATTLSRSSYYQMFYNCSNLKSVTCLATSGINVNNSTMSWLEGAGPEDTKIFKADPNANWPEGVNGIPNGWTRMDGTPDSWTEGTVYNSGNIDLRTLQVGDILMEGVTMNTNTNSMDQMYLNMNRYAVNGTTAYWGLQNLSTLVVGEKGLFSDFGQTFTPITESGADGNAWVVTSIVDQSGFGSDWKEVYLSGISHSFPLTPNANHTVWTLAGTPEYDIELQVNYYPQYKLMQVPANWTVTADDQPINLHGDTATIIEGAQVLLTPEYPDRVKSVRLLSAFTVGDIAVYYLPGESWSQAIANHPVNTSLVINNGSVCKSANTAFILNYDFLPVSPDTPIDPTLSYQWLDD